MYHVSAQGIDEHMINVYYYCVYVCVCMGVCVCVCMHLCMHVELLSTCLECSVCSSEY